MAQYNPASFGPLTPQQALERFYQRFGFTPSNYYTVAYVGAEAGTGSIPHTYHIYAITLFASRNIEMEGTVLTPNVGTTGCIKTTSQIYCCCYRVGYEVETDSFGFPSAGTGGWTNLTQTLYYMCNMGDGRAPERTWAETNMYSTVNIRNITDSTYDYNAMDAEAEFFATKDPNEYLMHLGVRATENSDFTDYAYRTKAYTIHIKWTSPVTGYNYDYVVPNLTEYNPHLTMSGVAEWYLSYTYTTGDYARALRMPLGKYLAIPPTAFDQGTDIPSIRDVPLTELRDYASTQHAGIITDDLMALMTIEFYYNQNLAYSTTIDWSSIFGEDIDITGSTVPDPNGDDSITDPNVYTDEIELTVPTITGTGVFNRCYMLDIGSVNDLCDYLYNANDSIFEEIIDGVLTRGEPIESLIDLRLYPFDISTVVTGGTAESIKFGRTNTGVIGTKLPNDANAVIDMGYAYVPRQYNNFLDYKKSLQLYIPFCGVCELPIDRVLNHKISVKMIVDYVTGACTAVVFVDKIPLLYQQGVMGVSIPMTATNSAEFGKTLIGNLVKPATSIASGDVAGAVKGGMEVASSLWEGSHIQTVGSSSPQVSLFQPKNCYLLISDVYAPDEAWDTVYADVVGYATFMPVNQIGNCTGYCEFDNVKMNITGATDAEKAEIVQALKEGVFL